MLANDNGARIAMIETGGWDTHAAQRGRLGAQLTGLDRMIEALQTGLGPLWGKTIVLVATEFGREVAVNGTLGTDHGTGGAAFVLGGAVKGGRVIADWPGLKPAQLYEDRDLAPTTDLLAILKGVLRDHLGLSERALSTEIFPDSLAIRPVDGLLV